jgi:acyl-CoA thioesterase-1
MEIKPDPQITRRGLAGLAALMLAAKAPAPVITMLGDSITAGLGLPAADALPAQLAQALARLGVPAVVRGAAVSGDTSADALARVDFSVQSDTRLCLVALGGNDLLQGIEPARVKANLIAIVRRLKARQIAVVLAGMRAPSAIGSAYAREFNAVFPAVAAEEGVRLYPFLLEGVAADPRLNQADGLHPNAAGVKIIAQRLAPALAKALRR